MQVGEGRRERERENENENPKQAPWCQCRALCGTWTRETMRSWPELKSRVRRSTDWATQAPLELNKINGVSQWACMGGSGFTWRLIRFTYPSSILLVKMVCSEILEGWVISCNSIKFLSSHLSRSKTVFGEPFCFSFGHSSEVFSKEIKWV